MVQNTRVDPTKEIGRYEIGNPELWEAAGPYPQGTIVNFNEMELRLVCRVPIPCHE
jgi:hypothetical protein